jgi:superfamily I DNA and/or RNA helicase
MAKKKNDLSKAILKRKQKENLDKIFDNHSLIKELNKKRKISSLKKLFPELVKYFPIWLTTPEVIASITNWQEVPFDFLVFDEASQVPLEKSIPLWSRAKKCIVIGDEQQLPPTDFFKSHLEVEEEIWEQEEKEAVLNNLEKDINLEIDDLEKNGNLLTYAKKYARNRERLTLIYHYRSRYPELIDFSNQAFYNGILQVVSASERRRDYSPIEYHYQSEGRWIDTENQVEARYIAELLKKSQLIGKRVGIITFNSKQRDLLIDLIEAENNYKNLFIKNLEEVQGDERDIIVFSIGYGPNKEGKILLNFGPLSNEGGEKRLNVAISRAREKIIVVTSLIPSDLSRIVERDENRKPGPKLFKKYLEYAYHC